MSTLASRAGGSTLAAALVVLLASQASADDRVELIAHAGYANAGSHPVATYADSIVPYPRLENGQRAPYQGGFAGEVAGGLRLRPTLRIGAALGFRFSNVDRSVDLTPASDPSRSAWTLGGYVRWSPELEAQWVLPWLSLGMGLALDSQTFIFGSEGATGPTVVRNLGLALPLQAGVGIRVVRGLSIGPFASFSPVIGLVGTSAGVGASDNIDAKTYAVWGLGLEVRVVAF